MAFENKTMSFAYITWVIDGPLMLVLILFIAYDLTTIGFLAL